MKTDFPELLSKLRKNANLTNIQLAESADVSRSLIPGLQSGKRVIGEYQARKLGVALGLKGADLEDFIFCAINNCTEKVLKEFQDYPAELLNLLARQLCDAGIWPQQVKDVEIDARRESTGVALTLNDGTTALLETKLKINE